MSEFNSAGGFFTNKNRFFEGWYHHLICYLAKPLKYNSRTKNFKILSFPKWSFLQSSCSLKSHFAECMSHGWARFLSLSFFLHALAKALLLVATLRHYYVLRRRTTVSLSLSLAPRFTQSASLSLVFARNSHSLYVHNNCSWSVCSIDRLCDLLSEYFCSKFQPVFPRVYKTGMMRWASGGRMTFTNNLLWTSGHTNTLVDNLEQTCDRWTVQVTSAQ